jgi:hypothetical protein
VRSAAPGAQRATWAAAYGAIVGLMLLLALRRQATPFRGEDWLDAITGILTRFGYFEGAFRLAKGFRLRSLFASSYGPAYYAYDAFRTFLFEGRILPFNEVTFRFVTSISAIVLVTVSAFVLRARAQPLQLLCYLLLVGTSPEYVSYYRNYCVYPFMMVFQNAAIVAFLGYLDRGRLSRLAIFSATMFLAVTTLVTSVNVLAGCLLFLAAWPYVRGWDRDLAAATREGLRPLFVGSSARMATVALLLLGLAAVVAFNWAHFQDLVTSSGLYQGSLAKSFQKTQTGRPDPLANFAAVTEETTTSLGPEFALLGILAVASVVAAKRLSHLSLIYALAFVIGVAECLFVVPTPQLRFAGRQIAYTFPLLVIVADNAGLLLARIRWGSLVLATCVVLVMADRGVRLWEDVRSVCAPGIAASPQKALGYVYRVDGLDDAGHSCTALDAPLDGPTAFYLDHLAAGVLLGPGAPSRICAAVLAGPPSRRMRRAIEASHLVNRRYVIDHGQTVLDVYLDDALAARWRHPPVIDTTEYSRHFTAELNTLDRLFDRRWAAAPASDFRGGFY